MCGNWCRKSFGKYRKPKRSINEFGKNILEKGRSSYRLNVRRLYMKNKSGIIGIIITTVILIVVVIVSNISTGI